MSGSEPFSRREGHRPLAAEIRIRNDAPDNLRYFAVECARQIGKRPSELRQIVCGVLHLAPDLSNWSELPNIWEEVQRLVRECEWYKVYDIIEAICRSFSVSEFGGGQRAEYANAINEFFVERGIGWKLEGCQVVTRGDEAFEAAMRAATQATAAAGHGTAASEIREALADLSRRPDPDLTGALTHSMAATECVAREVTGDAHATLGEILQRYTGLVPRPLDQALDKAWGFASEHARHLREGGDPTFRDVELVVTIAAAVVTYLSR